MHLVEEIVVRTEMSLYELRRFIGSVILCGKVVIFTQVLVLNDLLDKLSAALRGLLKEFGQFGFVLSYSNGMYILPDLPTCL